MWKYYALLSAFFAALTAIFAKIGVRNIDSDLATGIRTFVILLITWGIVFCGGAYRRNKGYRAAYLDFSDTFRHCYRSFLAVLFQGASKWGSIARCSGR